MTNYRKSAKERLVDALNLKNPTAPILLGEVTMSAAQPATQPGCNSSIIITAAHTRLVGHRTVFYNRLDLTTLLTTLEVTALVIPTGLTQTHQLLPLILEQWNVLLLPEEIINETIPAGDITIRCTPAAVGWVGSYTITVDSGIVHVVMGLDNGSGFLLDNGALLLNG